MKKHENLQDRLARSLDSANRRETKAAAEPERASREPVKGWIRNPDARVNMTPAAGLRDAKRRPRLTPASPATGRLGAKLSISLFAADLARLKEIQSYIMASLGKQISTSQAVKLALRTAPLSEELTAALAEIRKEDGRASR
jgi:hypothetical protein